MTYLESNPSAVEWLKNNELPLGIALSKNGLFDCAFQDGLKFKKLTHFDFLRSPVFEECKEPFCEFDLVSVYRIL